MPWREPKLMDTRTEFAQLALKKEKPFRHLCQDYGVSPKTGYKWLERYRQSGKGGMADRSRPGKSQDNGAHERMYRDIALEIEAVTRSRTGDLSGKLLPCPHGARNPHDHLGSPK